MMAEPPKPVADSPGPPGDADAPKPAQAPRPAAPAASPPARRGGGFVLAALLLLILALLTGGFVYLAAAQPAQLFALLRAAGVQVPGGDQQNAGLTTRVADLQTRLAAVEEHQTAAGTAPPPAEVDLGPIEQRLDALEHRVAAIENRPAAAGEEAAEREPPAAPVDLGPIEQRLAALEQRTNELTPPPDLASRLQAVEQTSKTAATEASRAARLQIAAAALDAGRPLGDIPGAPPALARFATVPPPTLSSLRLAFPAAAEAAERASAPSGEGLSFTQRLLATAERLVTVRQGETVLVGAPATVILTQARGRLDAGDLAGALADLDSLDPAAARAMAPWRDQAQALLEARAALAGLANS